MRRFSISCFALFLASGALKDWMALPVDLTLLFACLTAAAALWYAVHGGIPRRVKLPIWLFAVAGFTMLPFTETTPDYGWTKALYFFTITALSVFAPYVLLSSDGDVRCFLSTFTAACALVALVALYEMPAAVKQRLGQEHTIVLGRACGIVLIWLITTSLLARRTRWWKVAIGAVFAFILVGSGSRAPLIFSAGTLLLVAFLVGSARRKVAGVVAICGLAATVYFCLPMLPQRSVSRILAFENMQEDKSASERLSRWSTAIDYVTEHPVGLGFGGFSRIYRTSDDRVYPHNLVLESGVEGGWLMMAAAIAYMWIVLRRAYRERSRWPLANLVFALALYLVLNAMVSGDLNDNRMMWAMLTLCWR